MKEVPLNNKQFGRLSVLEKTERRTSDGNIIWRCVCSCGKMIEIGSSSLNKGHTKSCGCLQRDRVSEVMFKHGLSASRTYKVWIGMKSRCSGAGPDGKKYYLGMGIKVCSRWEKSFENFLADMGPCPPNKTIDRIDGAKGYFPANCRWASWTEQARNTKRKREVTAEGLTLRIVDWAKRIGVTEMWLHNNLRSKSLQKILEERR